MRKLLIAFLIGVFLFSSVPARAQEEEPQSLWDLTLRTIEYVCENGTLTYLYDFVEEASRAAFKLNILEIENVIDVDIAGLIDRVDREPGLVACVGTSLDNILEKVGMDVELPFDLTAGVFAGYDFGTQREMYGLQIGWKIEF